MDVIGVGESEIGSTPNTTAFQLYVDAVQAALVDSGRRKEDVDVLVTASSRAEPWSYHSEYLAEYLGMEPRYCYSVMSGGGTIVGAVGHVAALIAAGHAEVGVIAAADRIRSGFRGGAPAALSGLASHPLYEQPHGVTVPALYALIAQRHMYEFGTTREQMACVAVAARTHATLTEHAQARDPITIRDVLDAKPVARPFHRLDCALISDGGGAIVLARRGADVGSRASVRLLGFGEGHKWLHVSQSDDLTRTAAERSGRLAFEMAGVTPQEVGAAIVYDAFTILPIILLEDLGFCAKGEGGAFVEGGRIGLGGALPINTHGGLLSYAHPGKPGGFLGLIEAVRQLRGEAGQRQVPDLDLMLVHTEGGVVSIHNTLILGRS